MSSLIPVKRIKETDNLLAFDHPQPQYPIHILLVPKRAYANLLELQSSDSGFLCDLLDTVHELIVAYNLEETGYRLIVNGGPYQDIPQLHFHLVSGTLSKS